MIFYQTPQVTVQWDDELKAVYCEWQGFIFGDDYKQALNKIYELFIQKKANRLFSDNRKMRVINQEDQLWVATEWVPKIRAAGLKHSAIIIPRSELADKTLKTLIHKVGNTRTDGSAYFDDIEKAKEWMRNL